MGGNGEDTDKTTQTDSDTGTDTAAGISVKRRDIKTKKEPSAADAEIEAALARSTIQEQKDKTREAGPGIQNRKGLCDVPERCGPGAGIPQVH